MTVLAIRDLTLRVAGRTLLDAASLAVDPGRKLGLVGRNGAGKSTLMRAISGELAPDGGEIRLAARARMAYLRQEAPGGDASLLDTVLAADEERASLLAALDTAPADATADIHERLRAIRADAAPSRAATVLHGLGFDAVAQQRSVGDFSGGWRMRVALAAALFVEPDVLLLDEPTNHLDLEATIWLEGWLRRFTGAAIIVSHDRDLLDRCVDGIAHLDRGKVSLYPGGYGEFVRIRTERAAQRAALGAKVVAERARIQGFVDRFRAKASKARQAQSRLKALERLPPVEATVEDGVTRFAFPPPAETAPPLLAMEKVSVGYGDRAVLRGLDLRLDPDDRVALLGSNGNGKSTLAKLLSNRLEPMAGTVRRHPRLKVGYFAQHQADELEPGGTPLSHMRDALPRTATDTMARAQLARFGLDADRAGTEVRALSGGERARLLLALCTRDAPGLLVLDEPTNHLDVDAREALVRALADYAGAVLLITHDPRLVELVADRLWLVADGTAREFDGDLDEYRATLAERGRAESGGSTAAAAGRNGAAPASNGAAQATAGDRRGRADARAALAPARERLREVEARLERLRVEDRLIERKLADPALYAKRKGSDIAWAGGRRAAIAREVEALEEEWLALGERLEAAAAAAAPAAVA